MCCVLSGPQRLGRHNIFDNFCLSPGSVPHAKNLLSREGGGVPSEKKNPLPDLYRPNLHGSMDMLSDYFKSILTSSKMGGGGIFFAQ